MKTTRCRARAWGGKSERPIFRDRTTVDIDGGCLGTPPDARSPHLPRVIRRSAAVDFSDGGEFIENSHNRDCVTDLAFVR